MDSVSRPLIALLVGTVAVFAVWLVALKPSASSGGGSASSPVIASAIAKAHQAVAISAGASVAHRGAVLTTPTLAAASTSAPAPGAPARPAVAALAKPVPGGATQPLARTAVLPARKPFVATPKARTTAAALRADAVTRALTANKTIALLFYNAAAADDRAVRAELATVPVHHGQVVKLTVPLAELARYAVVTNQVTVSASPTLVLIDRAHRASTLVGFADRFEIAQRVSDALAAP